MIDYARLARAVEYYEEHGFTRVESPWLVTPSVVDITAPKGIRRLELKDKKKELVASGEQSFLYLYLKGFLPKGKFQTITPCFRDEVFDLSHCKYFMKNELIVTDDVGERALSSIVEQAQTFLQNETKFSVTPLKTEEGFDLMLGDYEIGSYGIRHTEYLSWIYGTGLAEPRMTMAIQRGEFLEKEVK